MSAMATPIATSTAVPTPALMLISSRLTQERQRGSTMASTSPVDLFRGRRYLTTGKSAAGHRPAPAQTYAFTVSTSRSHKPERNSGPARPVGCICGLDSAPRGARVEAVEGCYLLANTLRSDRPVDLRRGDLV